MSENGSSAIRFEGVTKRFGESVAVDDLNLEIERGEFLTCTARWRPRRPTRFGPPSRCRSTTSPTPS